MRVTLAADAKMSLYSYGKNDPRPPNCQYVFDVSNFRDPTGQAHLKDKDGRDVTVQKFVEEDPRVDALCFTVLTIIKDTFSDRSRKWVSIGFCDHHGIRLAPACLELVAEYLEEYWSEVPFLVRHFHWLPSDSRP